MREKGVVRKTGRRIAVPLGPQHLGTATHFFMER